MSLGLTDDDLTNEDAVEMSDIGYQLETSVLEQDEEQARQQLPWWKRPAPWWHVNHHRLEKFCV
jgi:hypothetical protein